MKKMMKTVKVMTTVAVVATSFSAMADSQISARRGGMGRGGSRMGGHGPGHTSRIQLEMQAKRLSSKVQMLIANQGDTLTKRELKKVIQLLQETKQVVKTGIIGGGDPPVVRPPARPPVRRPLPPRNVACSQAGTNQYQNTFIKIKQFAYAGDGLNKTTMGAQNYAHQWLDQYPCSVANKFINDFKRVRVFAYSGTGLNKTTAGSINFALDNVAQVCSGMNFEQKFQNQFDFAYSSQGLNMTSAGARNYASDKVLPIAFSCNNL